MADDAELTIEELQRLRRAASVGDRDRLARMRAPVAEISPTDMEIRSDVEAQKASEPSIWESIKRWWLAKSEDEKGAGRRDVGDAVTRALPPNLSATDAIRRQRARMRSLDRLAE